MVCEIIDVQDPDADILTFSFDWRRDGETYAGPFETTVHAGDTVPAAELADSVMWQCTAQAGDGDAWGPTATTTTWSFDTEPAVWPTGIDLRPENSTCLGGPGPVTTGDYRLEPAYGMELDLYRPIEVLFPEGALMDHVYVAMREGQVIRFEDSPHAETYEITLDITDPVRNFGTHQGGFMSAAFHPDFDLNGELYVFYLHSEEPDELDAPWSSRLSRFTSFDGGATFGDDTEEIILDEPRVYVYHHGGHLAFDPDGYLLLSLGDGGGSLDPFRYGQDPFHLFASIIRIDVDGGVPYAIPPDNPFADGYEGAPEVYAYGLRNAHQFSFDSLTGELWAADVGSMAFEEVNRIEPGGNYGWRVGEGHSCFADPASCDDPAIIDPVYTYRNVGVSSIIGGAVYSGTLMPELDGHYVFADHFLEGPVSALAPDGMGGWEVHSLIRDSKTQLSTWTQGRDGELYAVEHYKALIKTLVPATTTVKVSSPPGPAAPCSAEREKTSAIAVELEIMHTARCTLARSPPGTTVGGW